ncbi:MAG TPA: Uma2 family endonuclease [Isosphaeraceae bacterium]|jgi:Uma2 family endonuclease|nr:Uma2 family endonuclease [Isosphaeraceae bacterium]
MSTHEPTSRLVLGPDDHGRPVTADEYAEADFLEPWKYERRQGRLVVRAPDSSRHDDVSEPWRDHLGAYKLTHPRVVQMVRSEAWVRVAAGTDRIGDIGVYLVRTPPAPMTDDRVPDLMFEFVSRAARDRKRDYVEKRADSHRLGIREYVIIDRRRKLVSVLTHTAEGYVERTLTPKDTYTTPLLPGLAIPLDEALNP